MRPDLIHRKRLEFSRSSGHFEIDDTIELIIGFIADRQKKVKRKIDRIYEKAKNLSELEKEGIDEAVLDLSYYNHLECVHLTHFGILRLYSLFEIRINELFYPEQRRYSFAKDLKDIWRKNLLNTEIYKEVQEWIKLRNEIVHSPYCAYDPIWIEKEDLLEFASVIKRVIKELEK